MAFDRVGRGRRARHIHLNKGRIERSRIAHIARVLKLTRLAALDQRIVVPRARRSDYIVREPILVLVWQALEHQFVLFASRLLRRCCGCFGGEKVERGKVLHRFQAARPRGLVQQALRLPHRLVDALDHVGFGGRDYQVLVLSATLARLVRALEWRC